MQTQRVILPKERKQWGSGVRTKLWHEADRKCFYCKEPLLFEKLTLDHKKPISRGGLDIEENLVASCKACNEIKGHLTAEEFIAKGGRGDRKIPYGYKKSFITKRSYLEQWVRKLPHTSRTRDAFERMAKGERVDISLYPRKVSESTGKDSHLAKVRIFARKFPEWIGNEGTVYWFK